MMILAYAIAILLPLGFLYLIYSQDLFGQGKFKYVLVSFAWGLAAFGGAYGFAVLLQWRLEIFFGSKIEAMIWLGLWLPVLIAPIVEEVLKSLALVTFLRKRITYFVDGAIYGFAAGIAFSILENILYLARGEAGTAVLLAILRVFSTCLMHGAASALVGIAIGRLRYGHGASRILAAVFGWVMAIGIHMGFNRLVSAGASGGQAPTLWPVLGALGVGMGGAVLIVIFIRWGLAEEKRWIQETLGVGTGISRVTRQEVSAVQQYDKVDELLRQIEERFGEKKAGAVEEFLLKQAQLGIKRKGRALSQNPREHERMEKEIQVLHRDMERIRQQVGVYCMSYVRSVFPEEVLEDLSSLLQRRVEALAARGPTEGKDSLETMLRGRMGLGQQSAERPAEGPSTGGIFGLAGGKEGAEDEQGR